MLDQRNLMNVQVLPVPELVLSSTNSFFFLKIWKGGISTPPINRFLLMVNDMVPLDWHLHTKGVSMHQTIYNFSIIVVPAKRFRI